MKRTIRIFLLFVIAISLLVFLVGFTVRTFLATRPLCDACNVIVIALDAISADSLLSSERRMPRLASRAEKDGVVFTNAIAQSRSAYPSMVSLFTGNYPSEYGTWDLRVRIPENTETLAKVFSSHGYKTAGFSENPLSEPDWGLNHGFEYWEPTLGKSAKAVFENAEEWLAKNRSESRTFLFIQPYSIYSLLDNSSGESSIKYRDLELVPDGDSDATTAVTKGYKNWMLRFDQELDSFLSMLFDSSIRENTIVVIVGSYGEELTYTPTRGMGPGTPASFRMLNVPLVFLIPNHENKSISASIETRSIGKTLFDIVGIPASFGSAPSLTRYIEKQYNQNQDALSFAPHDPKSKVLVPPEAIAEIKDRAKGSIVARIPTSLPENYFVKSILHGQWHVTENAEGVVQVFNTSSDPDEKYDLEKTLTGIPPSDEFTISRMKRLIKITK